MCLQDVIRQQACCRNIFLAPVIWRLLLLASLFSWHLLLLASFSWDALLISSHLISSHVFPPHLISSRLTSPDVFSSRLVSSRLFSLLFQIALAFLSSRVLMSALLFSSCLRSSSPSFVKVSFSSHNRCNSSVFRRPKARAESRLRGPLDDSTLHSSSQLSSSPLFSSRLLISSLFISSHLLAANLNSSQRIPPHPRASQLASAPFSSSSVSIMIILKLMFNCSTATEEKQQNKTKQENLTEGQWLKAVSTSWAKVKCPSIEPEREGCLYKHGSRVRVIPKLSSPSWYRAVQFNQLSYRAKVASLRTDA